SVWQTQQRRGQAPPRRAQRLDTSPPWTGSIANPSRARRSASNSWQPPSSGVTERREISSRASRSVAAGSPAGMVIFGGTGPAKGNRVGPDDRHQCYARSVSLVSSLNSLNGALLVCAVRLVAGLRSLPAAKSAPAAVLLMSQSKLFAESALE